MSVVVVVAVAAVVVDAVVAAVVAVVIVAVAVRERSPPGLSPRTGDHSSASARRTA